MSRGCSKGGRKTGEQGSGHVVFLLAGLLQLYQILPRPAGGFGCRALERVQKASIDGLVKPSEEMMLASIFTTAMTVWRLV
jgi:hypothetical protein